MARPLAPSVDGRTNTGVIKTEIADRRGIPLGQLPGSPGSAARRVVPPSQTPKPPVAAFESAM